MKENKLEFLSTVSSAIQGLLEPTEAFETMLDVVSRVINYRYATLFGYCDKQKELIPIVQRRQLVDLIPSIRFSTGSGLSAWVASKQKPILLSRIHTSPHLAHRVVKSFISIPFIQNDELLGVLNLGHSIPGAFNMDDLEMGIKLSEELAGLLKRYLLLNDLYNLDERFQDLKEKYNNTEKKIQKRETENLNYLAKAVSHHVNNPLTTIIGNAQFLMADMENVGSLLKGRLQKIIDESERIAIVVEDLKNLEIIETEEYVNGDKMLRITGFNERKNSVRRAV